MKYETIEELRKALSEQKKAAEKVQAELSGIINRANFILGPDGAPTQESMLRIDNQITGLLNRYLQAPSLLEQDALHNLSENSTPGASFSVAILLGASVFSPLSQMVPMMANTVKPLFQYILTRMSDEGGASAADLMEESIKSINVRASDQTTGAQILDPERQFAVAEQVSALVGIALDMSIHQKFSTAEEGVSTITPLGSRVLAHMVALDTWMKDISEAQKILRESNTVLLR